MLKLESQSQDVYKTHQQMPILDRKGAKNYQQLLNPQNCLYQEINRILISHQNGIHQLSTGQKIDATKITLRGGGKESVQKFSVTISGAQDFTKHYFQALEGKRITGYEAPKLEGREEDIKLIISNVTLMRGSVKEKDLKDWERAGGGDVKVKAGGMGGSVGAHGDVKTRDQKEHEEEYSNTTVVLEVKAASPGLLQSMKPVTISVDVWFEDIPEKKEVIPLKLISRIDGSTAATSISSRAGNRPARKEDVNRMETIESLVNGSTAKEGGIDSEANVSSVITAEQMKQNEEVNALYQDICKIDEGIEKLKKEKVELIAEYKNEGDDLLKKLFIDGLPGKLSKIDEDLTRQNQRRRQYEDKIDSIRGVRGSEKEEEKK